MSATAPMPLLQIRPKRQLTLPADLAEAAGLKVGDYIEMVFEDGQLVIKPKELADRKPARSLTSFIGAAKGLYATSEEADRYIAQGREE